MDRKNLIVTIAMISITMVVALAVMPAQGRLAPPGNACDRQAIINEAWLAMTGQPYSCGGKYERGYFVSAWNYMASDMAAWTTVYGWYGGFYAGWAAKNPQIYGYYKGMYYTQPVGRGGQCKFFVNLILYRSGADQRLLPLWSAMFSYTRQIDYVKPGDVIITNNGPHIAIVVSVGKDSLGKVTSVSVIDSNAVPDVNFYGGDGQIGLGETIAFHTFTKSYIDSRGYRVYTGVDYYWYN